MTMINKNGVVKRFLILSGIVLAVFWATTSYAVQISTDITITGTINGESLAGTGTSISDTDTGIADTSIIFTSIPTGFAVNAYGKSWKTKHHKNYCVYFCGMTNFLELSPDGYSFNTTMIYDSGLGVLTSTGAVTSTGPNSDLYTLDIQGTYSGPLDAVGVQTQPAPFTNVGGSPGDIAMTDREIILFSDGSTLGLTETGVFSLYSGATLPKQPDYLSVDVQVFSFDSNTSTLTLTTRAVCAPEPVSSSLFVTVQAVQHWDLDDSGREEEPLKS